MKKLLVLSIIAIAAWMLQAPPEPTPAPTPPPGELDLSGAFVGETAADDAATVAAMTGELADLIEWDQMQGEPILTTGMALDELRVRARELRCRGRSIGQAHPEVARRVGNYLDQKVGKAGGPVTPKGLASWVAAYREISRAAARVID